MAPRGPTVVHVTNTRAVFPNQDAHARGGVAPNRPEPISAPSHPATTSSS